LVTGSESISLGILSVTSCLQDNYYVYIETSIAMLCQSSGVIAIQGPVNVVYSLQLTPITTYSYVIGGTPLNITANASSNFVISATFSNPTLVTFVFTMDRILDLTINFYQGCTFSNSLYTSNCQNRVCTQTIIYPQSNYYINVFPNTLPTGPYQFNLTTIVGTQNCANITNQTMHCQGHLSPSNTYLLYEPPFVYDDDAYADFLILQSAWPSCNNNTLMSYACQVNFQPHQCTSNGLGKQICYNDCYNTLTNQCGNNLCASSACESITDCTTPPAAPAGTVSLSPLMSIIFGFVIFFVYFI